MSGPFRWLRNARGWIKVTVGAVTLLVISPIYNGVVGNRADALFMWLAPGAWSWLGANVGIRETIEVVLVLAVPLAAIPGWRLGQRGSMNRLHELEAGVGELEAVAPKFELLLRLDDGLLRAMPRLLPRQDREATMRSLVRGWLRDCAALFAPDVSRATLLRPVDLNWMEPWESYGMPESSLAGRRFYIGKESDPARRGIAGEVYASREHRVIHVRDIEGRWLADDPAYIDFEGETRFPRYLAFVAVPVYWQEDTPAGVLCLDSKNPNIFDQEPLVALLLALGRRIGMAVEVYELLQEYEPA